MRERRAYSLIEVLVVALVVAVLLAVLAPQLAGARGAARTAKCLSNLRGLATAIAVFADGHSRFPLASEVEDETLGNLSLSRIVIGDEVTRTLPGVFKCPLDDVWTAQRGSYSFLPARFMRAMSDTADYHPVSDAEAIEMPKRLLTMFDSGLGLPVFQDALRFHIPKARRAGMMSSPTNEGLLASYMDGSARAKP